MGRSFDMATGLIVHLEIASEQRDEFAEIARTHGACSMQLEGGRCLSFEVFIPVDDPNGVILVESYTDDAALQAHWDSAHMAEYTARVGDLIVARQRYRCVV